MKELFGLVACGGKSFRMGTDKCLLEYHGMPHWKYIYDLLNELCVKVIISCNKAQAELFSTDVEKIIDEESFLNSGPMAGLMSAFNKYHDVAFLYVGCDYPFISNADLKLLIKARNEDATAIAFYNNANNIYEPLIAIYEPGSFKILNDQYKSNNYSLRIFLDEILASKIIPLSQKSILSVDTIDAYEMVKGTL